MVNGPLTQHVESLYLPNYLSLHVLSNFWLNGHLQKITFMLECIQVSRVGLSSKNGVSQGGSDRLTTGRLSLWSSPTSLPCILPSLHGERSPRLPNLDAAEGHIWSVYLGNKRFLIPWQQGCLQSPCSNRAVFIEFLCTEYTHAWDFNSFVTVKHLVILLSEASQWVLLDTCVNFGLFRSRLGKKSSMWDFRGSPGRKTQEGRNLFSPVACFVTKCVIKSQTWNKKAHILLLITTHPQAFRTDGSTKHQNSSAYKLAKGPAVLLTEGVVRALHYLQIEILLERITVICRTWSRGFGKIY